MSIIANTEGLVLPEGEYFVEWSTTGSLTSGPWQPTVYNPNGTGLQFASEGWVKIDNNTPNNSFVELPFVLNGSSTGGVIPDNFIGFNIYRNGEFLAYVPRERSYEYLDQALEPGVYDYQVAAVYDEGESDLIGPATVSILAPPTLLSAEQVGDEIQLAWESNFVGGNMLANQETSTKLSALNYLDLTAKSKQNQAPYIKPEGVRQGGDLIEDAFEITEVPFMVTGTTTGYTNDYDEECTASGSTAPDVVYEYTPTESTFLNIDMCGSS
jgi:hypothetical protein